MTVRRIGRTRLALAAALACGSAPALAQVLPPPPPAPGGGGESSGEPSGDAANTAPSLDDASPVAFDVAPGAMLIGPLPAPGSRGADAEGDALGWAFDAAPGETRLETDGGTATLVDGAGGWTLSFMATDGFEGDVPLALRLVETDTDESLAAETVLPVTVTVRAAPTLAPAPAPEPEAEPEAEPAPVPEAEPQAEPELPPEPEAVPEPEPMPEPSEPDAAPEPEPETVADAGPTVEPEPATPVADADAEPADGAGADEVPDTPAPEQPAEPGGAPDEEDEPAEPTADDTGDAGDAGDADGENPDDPVAGEPEVDMEPEPGVESESGPETGPELEPESGPAEGDGADADGDLDAPPPMADSEAVEPEAADADATDGTPADGQSGGAGDGPSLGLRVVATSPSAIALEWEPLQGATYTLERDGVPIATLDAPRYTDVDVVGGTTYAYELLTTAADGTVVRTSGHASATAEDDAAYADVTSPLPPGETVALRREDGAVVVAWHPGGDDRGVAGYDLYRDGRYYATVYSTAYVDVDAPESATTLYDVAAFDEARNYSRRSRASFVDGPVPATDAGTSALSVPTDASGRFAFAPVNRSDSAIVIVGDDAATALWPSVIEPGARATGFVTADASLEVYVLPAFGEGEPSGLRLELGTGGAASSTLVFDPAMTASDGE